MTRRLFVALALCAVSLVPLRAGDISGKWTASFDTQIGKQNYTYDFKVSGTTLTGRAKSDNGDTEIKEGKVTGDEISFSLTRNIGGTDMKVLWKGTMAGDDIKFTRSVQGGAGPGGGGATEITAKRAKP